MTYALEVDGLRKSFDGGKSEVLAGVDLRVNDREILFILGPSGAGKSVLLRHILGLSEPDSGKVLIQGRTIPYHDGESLNEIRRSFGVLFQGAALFDSMSVSQNIDFPLHEHRPWLDTDQRGKIIDHRLRDVGLCPERDRDKFPRELSGGMKKRVGLARAIVLEPKILLFDEPTTGLDPVVRATVDELILEFNRKLGITSVVISHDLRAALNYADRIAFLDRGAIIFSGSPDKLLSSDLPPVRSYVNAEIHRPRKENHAH